MNGMQAMIEQQITISRALGIIEGVMLLSDDKAQEALASAVEMIDVTMKEVFRYE